MPLAKRPPRDNQLDGSARWPAYAYVKSRVFANPIHSDLLEVYDDDRFVPLDRRS